MRARWANESATLCARGGLPGLSVCLVVCVCVCVEILIAVSLRKEHIENVRCL